jgi:hypothetical protein
MGLNGVQRRWLAIVAPRRISRTRARHPALKGRATGKRRSAAGDQASRTAHKPAVLFDRTQTLGSHGQLVDPQLS